MIYTLLIVVIFIANIVQAISGFAGTMLAMPFVIRFIGMDSTRVVLNFMGFAASLVVIFKDYKMVNIKAIKGTIIWLIIGMIISFIMYTYVNAELLLQLYGIMIILLALKGVFIKKEFELSNFFTKVVLILAGIVQGLFASGGPLLVVHLIKITKSKEEFRVTISVIWVLLTSIFLIRDSSSITLYEVKLSLIALVPMICGVFLGSWIHNRISRKKFMKLTNVLLLISGVSIFIN